MGCGKENTSHSSSGSSGSGSGGHAANSLWYVGVILSIVGSVCTNMGVNLQKYSFMCEAKKQISLKRSYAKQPFWVIGLVLVVGGSLLDFVALGFLPQSLATPVGGSTMVANVAFASLFLKEKFSRMDAIGTGLVLGGICIVAAFANKESACYTVTELVGLYSEPLFVMYSVFVCVSCLGMFALTKKLEKVLRLQGSGSQAYKKFARIHPVTYPALSGIFGAQSVLFAKSTAELFKTTIEGTNQFTNVGTYVIVLSMFGCVFLQIHWLAAGLQSFDAVFVVPVFQCFFISVSIFGGGVYFKEFSTMSTLALVMFFFGACVTLSGVYLLSCREMNALRPVGKLRACVKMVIFIKRVQKIKNINHTWTQPGDKLQPLGAAGGGASPPPVGMGMGIPVTKSALPSLKLSKASVMPIDSNYPLPPPAVAAMKADDPPAVVLGDRSSDMSTALDSSSSHIQITPKRLDK